MDDTELYFGLRVNCRDGVGKSRQAVNRGNQNIVNAPILQVSQD